MLDAISPQQLAEWVTYRKEHPDPFEVLIETLKVGFAALCQVQGAKVSPEDFDVVRKEKAVEPANIPDAISMILGKPNGSRRPGNSTGRSNGSV